MMPITLEDVVKAVSGILLGELSLPSVSSVCTDTRALTPGCLFVALRGETHDGHSFVNEALAGGAAAALISDPAPVDRSYHASGRLIRVPDTLVALGRLAGWYRRQIAAQVVAVVGSNGKTTTKDMLAAVLGSKKRGRAARASFNNAVGVPMTLLSAEPSDEFVVVEIGTNHPGEIASLGRIVRPNHVVVTSIGEEHLEFLGDVDAVAREELSILSSLRDGGFAAIQHEAARFLNERDRQAHTVCTFGLEDAADLRAVDVRMDAEGTRFALNGRREFRVPLLGVHNAVNALGVIAICARFRMSEEDVAVGLLGVKPAPMRLERTRVGRVTVINDAYNANPSSMKTAFDTLDRLSEPGRKVLLLGDMAELGEHAERCHRAVGREAGRSSAQLIVVAGGYGRIMADAAISTGGTTKRIVALPSVEALIERLETLIEPDDVVLIKASRKARLERVLDPLRRVVALVAA